MAETPHAGSSVGRRRSLERGLPLMMTVVLAATLAISLGLTYATLARVARVDAAEGLERAALQLSSLAEGSVGGLKNRLRGAARDTVVTRAVAALSADSAATLATTQAALTAARVRLAGMLTPADSGLSVELVTPQGQRIAFAGVDPTTAPEAPRRDRQPARAGVFDGHGGLGPTDSVRLSRLYAQRGDILFSAIAPVVIAGRREGYLLRRYRIAEGGRAEETIRALAGPDITVYYHNPDGTMWTTIAGKPTPAPAVIDSSNGVVRLARPGTGPLLATQHHIAGTPFLLSFEVPFRAVLATPKRTVRNLAIIALVLTIVGAAATWIVSRRITRPLAALTEASESVGRGQYDIRVPLVGHDELVRLAAAFNRMAEEVGAARRELEMQARDAEQARMQAETASRAKSEFLAVMSHELRTPLNAIAGYTELLQMELRGPITEAQRRDLDRIRASEQHLLGLIGAVLDLSRIEAGHVTYDPRPIAAHRFLESVETLVAPQASAKSLLLERLSGDPELAVVADREKLRQVMLNLLSNAIRYTQSGGRVTLSAEARDGSTVAITVRDTGPGIPTEASERIFEPFVQLDRSLTRTREGVGLGLAISRDLARGMGGDLTVCSEPGVGSAFILTMPRTRIDAATAVLQDSGEMPAVRGG